MATISTLKQGPGMFIPGLFQVLSNIIDCSVVNLTASDVIQALDIPEGTFVSHVAIDVMTAEGAAGVVDVGDGDDPDGWDEDVDINATGKTVGDGAYAGGKWYAADDTIDIIPDIDLDTAKIRVLAIVADAAAKSTEHSA